MKRMKKVFAMLLAFAMVMGVSLTSFAAPLKGDVPSEADDADVTVQNILEEDAQVYAYQIIDATYKKVNGESLGITGYEVVAPLKDVLQYADTTTAPDALKVAQVAQKINAGTVDLTKVQLTDADKDGNYTAKLTAGQWIVLVRNTVKIYNPIVLSVNYQVDGETKTNIVVGGTIDAATANWDLSSENAYAKSSSIDVTKVIATEGKKADKYDDAAYGDLIKYEITTVVPDYSEEYNIDKNNDGKADVTFVITDTMDSDILLKANTVVVEVTGQKTTPVYDVKEETNGFVVTFDPSWILDNPFASIKVKCDAELKEGASLATQTALVSNDNTVELRYTEEPGKDTKDTDVTKHYTFEVNGDITKVDEKGQPLPNAVFTLTKGDYVYTATSDANGNLHFYGLDDGEYTLVEVEAPDGYSLNTTEYKVVVTPSYDNNVLKSYSVTVDGKDTATINNTPISALPSTGGIGTAVFTIGGCAIMIAAAYFFLANRKKES